MRLLRALSTCATTDNFKEEEEGALSVLLLLLLLQAVKAAYSVLRLAVFSPLSSATNAAAGAKAGAEVVVIEGIAIQVCRI